MTFKLRSTIIKISVSLKSPLLMLLILLSSCISYSSLTYFEPSPTPQITLHDFGRGPKDGIEAYLPGSVKLQLMILAKPKASLIRALIEVPQGSYVRLLSDEFRLLSETDAQLEVAGITDIKYNDIYEGIGHIVSITSTDTLKGATYERETAFGGISRAPRTFEIEALTEKWPPDKFLLAIPELEIDGAYFKILPIPYQKKQGTFLTTVPMQ